MPKTAETPTRVVVFGMPDAGKTSLLGALAQVGVSQTKSLGGQLHEGGALASLRHQLYEEHTRETQQEIVPYPVRVAGTGPKNPTRDAVVIDCDGRAVNDILSKKHSINQSQNAKQLAEAITTADSLIFVVDAAAPADLRDRDFREFARFLKHFEAKRAGDHGVGGLPVFLVLSKCDKLAGPKTSSGEWQATMEARCHDAARRFREVLAETGAPEGTYWKFGSTDFHVRPTSVKRPALTDLAEHPKEPYGVAELFNEVFGDAAAYRRRSEKSSSVLSWTVAGLGGLLGTLAVSGAFLFLNPVTAPQTSSLSDRVDRLQASEGQGAPARLAAVVVEKRLKAFQDVVNDREFDTLSELQKNYVRLRLDESQAYLKFSEDLAAVPAVRNGRGLAELTEIERRLTNTGAPPVYRSEWEGTDAVLLRDRLLTKDIPQLRTAVTTLVAHFHALKNRGSNLLLESTDLTPDWERKARDVAEDADKTKPFPKADPLLGSAYLFDDVILAEADWQKVRMRLEHLRDLATALGMLGSQPDLAPLTPATHKSAAEAVTSAERSNQTLKKLYPDYARWSLSDMPDAVLPEFQKRLKRTREELVRDGQLLMLDRFKKLNGGGPELASDWPKVGEYLLTSTVQDWRELTNFVSKLSDPATADAVETTAAFLRTTSKDFQFKRVTLHVPDTLTDQLARPVGDLIITCRKSETSDPQAVRMKLDGEPRRDQQIVVFSFAANADSQLTWQAGDIVTAEALLKKGDTELKLTWNAARTRTFQFETLQNPPKIHDPKSEPSKGVTAVGVKLTLTDGKFLTVPAMVPNVRGDKP